MESCGYAIDQVPPGRMGAYAALGEEGYFWVCVTGDSTQIAMYIRRAIAFHGGVVLEEDALDCFAQEIQIHPGAYTELLTMLRACEWISWPGQQPRTALGLQRTVSTHSASPGGTSNQSTCPMHLDFGLDGPSPTYVPVPSAEQALMGLSTSVEGAHIEPSAPPLHKVANETSHQGPAMPPSGSEPVPPADFLGSVEPGLLIEQPMHSEVHMDSAELCSKPFDDLGPLLVTAPPWRPHHMFSQRCFVLVLRNPREPSKGLVLMSSTDRGVVLQTAQGILAELNAVSPEFVSALSEPTIYDALNHDPALLAAIASSYNLGGEGGGLSQVLSSLATNSSAPLNSTSDSAHQPEEAGDCPICFEAIDPGQAAMRCAGEAGVHHYFHAHCLQRWIQSSRVGAVSGATCPMCRGRIQFNGRRLQEFLDNENSAGLGEDERSLLQAISDGLKGRNDWADMTGVERAAHIGGVAAAAGLGFMIGYTGSHHAERATMELMHVAHVPMQHQVAQGVGWVAGLLVRIIREREEASRRRRRS